MVERDTFPIPDGYRMLQAEEIIQAEDMAWAYYAAKFIELDLRDPLVGKPARRAVCAIRKDDNYLLENIIKRGENLC